MRASAAEVDDYYERCIPFYREFLGEHWHTGWYLGGQQPTVRDQLRMELRIGEAAGLAPGMRVLDVGCGIGGPAVHLASEFGVTVVGLTPVAAQARIATQRAADAGLTDAVQFVLGRAEAMPFDTASFDAVLFFESACHFADRLRFFTEARRVLTPGGRMAGEDWLAAGSGPHDTQADAWHRRIEETWAIPRLGSLRDYVSGLQAAGFEAAEGIDMRDEMPLLKGFAASEAIRAAVQARLDRTDEPIRREILIGLLALGEAAERGAFTVGRFRAIKPG